MEFVINKFSPSADLYFKHIRVEKKSHSNSSYYAVGPVYTDVDTVYSVCRINNRSL